MFLFSFNAGQDYASGRDMVKVKIDILSFSYEGFAYNARA